ncbi:MAG: prolyl oligopeptidase family serine peptidase, partial [Eudoraea sp.]|nr:prolyl oligopeptidase family serine peptidase [Eudoraea sp.]
AHSFKFAAELQDKHSGDQPAMIRIETNAGHGAGTPVSKTIEQYSDIFAFTLYNMGFVNLPNQAVLKEFKTKRLSKSIIYEQNRF